MYWLLLLLVKITNINKTKPNETRAWFRSPFSPSGHETDQANSTLPRPTRGVANGDNNRVNYTDYRYQAYSLFSNIFSNDTERCALSLWHLGFCRAMPCKCGLCRPSVGMSCSYILSKRVIVSSKFFHHRVAKPF